jgi:insertion element IS1 protein InsB
VALCSAKKNKLWIFKALDRATSRTIAWVVGKRNKTTLKKLYDKLSHLKATFYTDRWKVFTKVLPKDRHVVGKRYTHLIESNNANTRHHLARMTRRTKVVSKSIAMVDLTIRLWAHYSDNHNFISQRNIFLSI